MRSLCGESMEEWKEAVRFCGRKKREVERKMGMQRESENEGYDINLTFGFLYGCLTLGLSPKLNVNETQM